MLRYTGHPFVDVGVATITVFADATSPAELREDHIEDFTQEIERIYMTPAMSGYLSYVVFANSRFANPAQINNPQYDGVRREILREFLTLWKWKVGDPLPYREEPADEGEQCAFSGDPAVIRVSKLHVPMISDETSINFVPEGRPKLPIAGWCVLALLAMPLGGLSSNGKMWLVHSYDPQTLQLFAAKNLERNFATFQIQSLKKLPNYKFAKTHLMVDLVDAQKFVTRTTSLTAYLFTSGGQRPEITIFQLPSNIVSFILLAKNRLPDAWQAVVNRAWAMQDNMLEDDGKIIYQERNFFYEDLFSLPQDAATFLRRYLLREPRRGKPAGEQKLDPRYTYSYVREKEAISWELTELFLERVMNMDKDRIRDIRDLADNLADYILSQDERLFVRLFRARNDYQMRLELLRAANSAKTNLMPYDQFINVFFIDEGETVKPDWYLARDLLMVRIIERLHETNWIESNPELVEEAAQEAQEGNTKE